jgi:hypothetical protein
MEQVNNQVNNHTNTNPNPNPNPISIPDKTFNEQVNLSNEQYKQNEQFNTNFDFYKDFEMREFIEEKSGKIEESSLDKTNLNNEDKQIEMMLESFPIINDNLRANILLGVEIYKKINNFEINYVHNIIDSINSNPKKNI